jgi:hypothetical protein
MWLKKYRLNRGISYLRINPKNSPVWNDLLKVRQLYTKGRIMLLGNSQNIDFWEDPWCGIVHL